MTNTDEMTREELVEALEAQKPIDVNIVSGGDIDRGLKSAGNVLKETWDFRWNALGLAALTMAVCLLCGLIAGQ